MSENLHNIDKLFRDVLEEHEDVPAEKIWDAVESNLDKNNVIQIKRRYNNLKKIAAVLLLLLLSTLVYELYNKNKQYKALVNKNINDKQQKTADAANKVADERKANTFAVIPQAENTTAAKQNEQTALPPEPENTQNKKNAADALNNIEVAADKIKHKQPAFSSGEKNAGASESINKTENGIVPVQNKNAAAFYSRTAVNKTTKNNTKIKIRNSVAEVDTENNSVSNENETTVVKELTAYDKTKLYAIHANPILNAAVIKFRQSPEAGIKNTAKKATVFKPFHFSVSAFFAPQYSSNNIKEESHNRNSGPGGPPQTNGNHHKEIKNEEQHKAAYSAGVLVEIPVGKNWSIQSGITYHHKNITIEPKKIYARLDNDGKAKYLFDCSSGYAYISSKTATVPAVGDSINAAASSNMLGYLGLPVVVNYNFAAGKFKIIPTVGTVINFLVKQKIETDLVQGTTKAKETINTIQGLKSTYFTASAGVSFEYALNKKIALIFTPAASFALSSINKAAAVKSYPNSLGLAGGLKIKF